MKITISSTELYHHLALAYGAISKNAILPILENFLFEIKGGKLKITGSNLDISILSGSSDLDIQEEGSVAIKANILIDTLKDMPGQPLEFVHEGDENNVHLHSSYGNYKIPCEPAEDYPDISSSLDDIGMLSMNSDTLEKAFNKTVFATSNDELRLAMSGVYFDIHEQSVNAVATDAHKLVRYHINEIQNAQDLGVIIPKKSIKVLKSLLGNAEKISFGADDSSVYFKIDGVLFISRLITEKYPNYHNVIPAQTESTMNIDRIDLLNSLKRTSNFANKTTNQVNFDIEDGQLKLQAKDMDFNSEAVETINCDFDAEPMQISFNSSFLIDMLGVLESNRVQFQFTSPRTACLIFPINEDLHVDQSLLMLIMPVAYN